MSDQMLQNIVSQLTRIADSLEYIAHLQAVAGEQADGEISFEAEELVPELLDGESYWKVKGGSYKKHGVRIWPEVLEAAGFQELQLVKIQLGPDWKAFCTVNEAGRPKKVIRLEKSQKGQKSQPANGKDTSKGNPANFLSSQAYFQASDKLNISREAAKHIASIAGVLKPQDDHAKAMPYLTYFSECKKAGLTLPQAKAILEECIMDPEKAITVLKERHSITA